MGEHDPKGRMELRRAKRSGPEVGRKYGAGAPVGWRRVPVSVGRMRDRDYDESGRKRERGS